MMERAPQPVREMLALLRESGHTPYLVGGCVRDLLRGAEPDDYDMTSDATEPTATAVTPRACALQAASKRTLPAATSR